MQTWATILAGGEGTRLKHVTRAMEGDARPKQFCRLVSERTLLDETRGRLAQSVEPAHNMLVLTAHHRPYYQHNLSSVPPALVVEQPTGKGTAAAIAYALGRIRRIAPDSVVVIAPSDHYYGNSAMAQQAISMASQDAMLNPHNLVLIGAEAEHAETDYGWIVPGLAVRYPYTDGRLFMVDRFVEKPTRRLAEQLLEAGGLWSTFITVATVRALQSALREWLPKWYQFSVDISRASSADEEAAVATAAYSKLSSACFSADLLAHVPDRCLVVKMKGAGWSDLGSPSRLAQVRGQVSA